MRTPDPTRTGPPPPAPYFDFDGRSTRRRYRLADENRPTSSQNSWKWNRPHPARDRSLNFASRQLAHMLSRSRGHAPRTMEKDKENRDAGTGIAAVYASPAIKKPPQKHTRWFVALLMWWRIRCTQCVRARPIGPVTGSPSQSPPSAPQQSLGCHRRHRRHCLFYYGTSCWHRYGRQLTCRRHLPGNGCGRRRHLCGLVFKCAQEQPNRDHHERDKLDAAATEINPT